MQDEGLQQKMLRLITGYWITQLTYVAAKLNLAEKLSNGPVSCHQLARACDVQPRELHRVLRALSAEGIFEEVAPRTFANTPLSEWLLPEKEGSLHARAVMTGEKDYMAWEGLMYAVKSGTPAFPKIFGEEHFSYLRKTPEMSTAFNQTMTQFAAHFYQAVLDVYDFSDFKTLVDVGGGHGKLLALILAKFPAVNGILFDEANVIETAGEPLRMADVAGRYVMQPGDFFKSVPAGDAYVLSHTIHDWDDEPAIKILQNIRTAIVPGGRLLLLEKIIPEGNQPSLAKLMDIHMLVLTGGLERTKAEYEHLLSKAGFRLEKIIPSKSVMSVIEARPV